MKKIDRSTTITNINAKNNLKMNIKQNILQMRNKSFRHENTVPHELLFGRQHISGHEELNLRGI